MRDFNFIVDWEEDIAIIHIEGQINTDLVADFENKLNDVMKETANIIIDVDGLTYLCSAALGVIINCFKRLLDEEGKAVLTRMNPKVEKIFDAIGFSRLVGIKDTLEEAISVFK